MFCASVRQRALEEHSTYYVNIFGTIIMSQALFLEGVGASGGAESPAIALLL